MKITLISLPIFNTFKSHRKNMKNEIRDTSEIKKIFGRKNKKPIYEKCHQTFYNKYLVRHPNHKFY